jgi:peptidoglycan/xylan/chitin deacetylase (PgdA/CDA1 family)
MCKRHVSAFVAAMLAASIGAANAQSIPISASATTSGKTDAKATASPPPAPSRPAVPACANADALGVSRVVEIDTTGGPGFGFEHFKAYDFLRAGEVVLTFDDGPWPHNTPMVLDALAAQCVKATFFPVGKHATWHPDILKRVAEQAHTIGSHTWSHADLSRLSVKDARDEIEKGISAVRVVLGAPAAPFFRFPSLKHPPELLTYLGERSVGIFSTDMDSFDFKIRKPEQVINSVMAKLKKHGKGIVLMHDFQRVTAEALPELLNQLKAGGYKVVHMKAKEPVQTLATYDELIAKEVPGAGANQRPLSNVVRTISE